MAERPHPPDVGVQIGDVYGSQLIIGDHNTIQTPDGAKITMLQVGERPVPRLRPLPVTKRPAGVAIVGRNDELALGASAAAGSPVQIYAPDGAGKTSLLKAIALQAAMPAEGVVFESTRRRTLDEIQVKLYTAFWESDVPFLPGPADVGGFLADREALLVLDDCDLDRDDLDALLDVVPRCAVVSASERRSLWSRGTAQALADLDSEAGLELFERELGRALTLEERPAAEALVVHLGGHPQSLVEAAASIADGQASLRELTDDPALLAQRTDSAVLTDSERRILEVLSKLEGAPLGVEHVAALANLPDALPQLRDLERRGWVKAASPRYRLVRPLSRAPGVAPAATDLAKRLLGHLARWSEKASASEVADEAGAIEAALDLGAASERWNETLALALAAEARLTLAGSWTAGRRVLSSGLKAAQALGDEPARARLLHQLGSLSLCLGDDRKATAQLAEALSIRERLGDQSGADLTRHNLGQMGSANGDKRGGRNGGAGRGPWRPSIWIVLGALGLVAAGLVAGLLTAGGGGDGTTAGFTDHTTTLPSGEPPVIAIERPADGATFDAKSVVTASYKCITAEGVRLESCEGTVGNGDRIDTSVGEHEFVVTAIDSDGRKSVRAVRYSVTPTTEHKKKPPPGEPPAIAIERPADGATFDAKSVVTASYKCTAAEGVRLESCEGTVGNGDRIDTSVGEHEFVVTAIDSDGRKSVRAVRYSVVRTKPSDTEPPTISILSPKKGGVYNELEQVPAEYKCTDSESGVASCEGTVPSGEPIETDTVRSYTFTVTASDNAGNASSRTVEYQVIPIK